MEQPVQYIQRLPELRECLDILAASDSMAFDLEFDRDRYTYGFDLCLVQIATRSHCFVIDAVELPELDALFRLFESAGARKLVHCPGEDLRLLHSLHCFPAQMADTEVIAKLLNYEQTSLSHLLSVKCGIFISKKLQTSNWARRPLTREQIQYAAGDVLYLHRLDALLREEAKDRNLMHMVEEEWSILNTVVYTPEPREDFLKKSDRQRLSPYDQYILNELFRFRDQLAREKNKPAYQMIPEPVLRDLASQQISRSDWGYTPGLFPSLRSAAFRDVLWDKLSVIIKEAGEQGLSRDLPRREQVWDRADWNGRGNWQQQKEKVMLPVQAAIGARYGEHAMRFLFSTSLIHEILKNGLRIGQLKAGYRKQIIREAAEKAGVDISPWW